MFSPVRRNNRHTTECSLFLELIESTLLYSLVNKHLIPGSVIYYDKVKEFVGKVKS